MLIFTFSQIALVTYSLSPVRTITLTPYEFKRSIADLALSFGGSKNPINPKNVILDSSFTENSEIFSMSVFWQTPITLIPCMLRFLEIDKMLFFISEVIGFIVSL